MANTQINIGPIRQSKIETSSKTFNILALFLILNGLKITLFNFSIMNTQTPGTFFYKFIFSLLLSTIFFLGIFKFKSPRFFLIFYIIESIYIFAILSYYSYFHNYLHIMQATVLFTEGVGSIKHITLPIEYWHLCIIIDIIPAIYICKHYANFFNLNAALKKYFKYIAIGFLVLILSSETYHYTQNNSVITLVKDYPKYEAVFVERYGTLISDTFNTILNNGGRSYIKQFKYGKAISNTAVNENKPNIVVIQVESLDANVINKLYNNEYIAPYLHSLSQEAIYYPYTLSYHLSGGTSDAEFSIINSIEPLSSFPSIKLSKYDYPNSVVKKLSNNSYKTYAFHGNIGNFYNRDVAFDKMGFDNFYDIKKMGFKDAGWGASDGDVYNFVVDKLKDEKGPFFSYIITMSSHMPFSNTKEYYKNSNYDDIEDETVRNYFTSISYVDNSIKEFVEQLRAEYENTYFIILGDHTPDINKEEYKQASYTSDGKYYEFVPMFVITPDNKKYVESEEAASFLDVAPTILSASGIQFEYKSDGLNLINPPETRNKIPFKQNEYDRRELFKNITRENK